MVLKVVANVAHVLAVNFTCEICNKSFSSKAAVDPYRSSDIEKS
jgi:transcription elongation factor Elf1